MVENIAKVLLNYLSDIVGKALPDNPDEKALKNITQATIVAYAVAKTYGSDIVASTENEIDDKVLSELVESCDEASIKYNFSLNPQDIE